MSDSTEFDKFFAGLGSGAVETTEVAVEVVAAVEEPKPSKGRFKEVEGKIPLTGAPGPAVMYPKGYVKVQVGPSSWNKVALYEEDFQELREFFSDAAGCEEFLAQARAAGMKHRKQQK